MTAILEQAQPNPDPTAPQRRFPLPTPNLTAVVLLAAVVCWLVSLPNLDHNQATQWGLLAGARPTFLISILLVVVGFAMAVRRGSFLQSWIAVFISIAILRVTFSIATAVPFYSWTYKHIGAAQYIQNTGTVARDVDIYNHWPGLFEFTAWLSTVSGISIDGIAHWYTPVAYVLEVGVLYALARVWRLAPMQAVVFVFLTHMIDWVGQGYFSPQWTAFMLSLGIITLLGLCRDGPRYVVLIALLFVGVVITHQLTPYWIIGVVFLLCITRQIKPWWLFLLLSALAIGFLAYNWGVAAQFNLLSVDLKSNIQTNVKTTGIFGQRVTSMMVRTLCAAFWGSALLIAAHRLVKRKSVIAQAALAFAAFGILVGQGYGGEAVFRVYLFSQPGCGLLVTPALYAALTRRKSFIPATLAMMLAAFLSAMGLFGNWYAYRVTKEQVTLARTMLNTLPQPVFITGAAPVWPERSSSMYVQAYRGNPTFDQMAVNAAALVGSHFQSDADYAKLTALVAQRGAVPTYLIITSQMRFYDTYFGILPEDALPNLQARIAADPKWSTYYRSDTVLIFKSNFNSVKVGK